MRMITARAFVFVAFLAQYVVFAHVMPRQTGLLFFNSEKPSVSFPNVTPGGSFSSGSMELGKRPLHTSGFNAHTFNPINSSTNISLCWFIVQDTVNIRYWAYYHTAFYPAVFNVTSLITAVTEYINTTVTHFKTDIVSTTTSGTTSWDVAIDSLTAENDAPQPIISIVELNGTALTSWGRTLTSPAPFYVYSTVKVIAAPAVTQKNGQLACVTSVTSDDTARCSRVALDLSSPTWSRVYTDWNSNAQRYFETSQFATNAPSNVPDIIMEIILPTPFIYSPDWGQPVVVDASTESDSSPPKIIDELQSNGNHGHNGSFLFKDYGYEDYGYVPRALIDIVTKLPQFTSILPPRVSILPGGPSVTFACLRRAAPAILVHATDLTVSTAVTTTSAGCFHPGACPLHGDPTSVATSSDPIGGFVRSPAVATPLSVQARKTVFSSTTTNFQSSPPTLALDTATLKTRSAQTYSTNLVPILIPFSTLIPAKSTQQALSDSPVPVGPVPGSQENPTREPGSLRVSSPATTTVMSENAASADNSRVDDLLSATAVITIASLDLSTNSASEFKIGSQTVVPGSAPVLVSVNKHSIDASAPKIATNDITKPLSRSEEPQLKYASVISTGSDRTANAVSDNIVGKQVLSPAGNPIIVSETTYSLVVQASAVVINGVTNTLPTYRDTNPNPTAVLSIGSLRLTADTASEYILDSKTLSPGGTPIVVSGTTYSLAPQASENIVNGVISDLSEKKNAEPTPEPVIRIGSQYLAPDTAFRYIAGSKTLIPGAIPIVVSGTTYSLASKASAVVINGITSFLPESSEATPVSKIRIDSQYWTLDPTLEYNLGSKTLVPGAAPITVSGTTYSLAPHASALVVNGVTSILQAHKSTSTSIPSSASSRNQIEYLVGSQTLSPGAPAIIISGIPISFIAAGNIIMINKSVLPISPNETTFPLTIASQIISATAISRSIAGDQSSNVETAQVSQFSANTRLTTPTSDAANFSNSSKLSAATSNTNGLESPHSIPTGEAIRRHPVLMNEVLGVLLGVVGLTFL